MTLIYYFSIKTYSRVKGLFDFTAFLRYVPAEAVIHTGGVEFGITKGVKSSPADLFLFLLNSNQ